MHGDIQTHLYMKNKMKKHEIEHIIDMIENGSKGGFYYGMTWNLKIQSERDIEDIVEQIRSGNVSGYNWQFRIKKYEKCKNEKEKMK